MSVPTRVARALESAPAPSPAPATTPLTTAPAPAVEETHPGLMAEVEYAEATFAFENKRYGDALKILEALTRRNPTHVEALELEALTFKTLGKEKDTIEVYERLLKLKPDKETGPYYFELGAAYLRGKAFAPAKRNLQQAIRRGFNVGISHFLIGTIDLQSHESLAAERNFELSLLDLPADMKVASHFYAGLAMSERGYGAGATRELLEAREEAKNLPDSPIARDTGKAAAKALAPMDHASLFGNLSLTSQYDGNVSIISPSVAVADSSGKESLKALFSGSVGWITSALRTFQFLVTYRFAANYNFNSASAIYQFATNTLTTSLTYHPVARLSLGLKAEGNYAFQNMESGDGSHAFSPFGLGGDFGPFARMELSESTQLVVDFSAKPNLFYADTPPDNLRRSGLISYPRAAIKYSSPRWYFNPELTTAYEINQARGVDFRSKTLSFNVANNFKISPKNVLTVAFDLILASYSERVPSRSDTAWGAHVTWIRELNSRFSLIADFSHLSNKSTLPELFSYEKPTGSLGLSYAF